MNAAEPDNHDKGLTDLRKAARWGARGALAIWAAVLSVVATSLMASHWVTLPQPEVEQPALVAAMEGLRGPEGQGAWMAVHVLYSKSACSRRIFDHLVESERPDGVRERVLLVDEDAAFEAGAAARGIKVSRVTPQELAAHYKVEAAPLLLVIDPEGAVRYSGGYTERKQGPAVQDIEIINKLIDAQEVSGLPLFGCGVSKRLQELLDPLGLKYTQTEEGD